MTTSSWFAEAATVAVPPRRASTRPRRRSRSRSRAPIMWIAMSAVLLAGVVFVNLAVLRLNLALDHATQERSQLRGSNASLQSQLSAALASPRIQSQARREEGLAPADQSTIITLAP